MRRHLSGAALFLLLACVPALAQQTTGTISGRVLDEQGNAIPGVSITARNEATGFTRTESTNVEGIYRLAALPVGIYEVKAALPGFSTVAKKDIEVAVALVQAIDFALKVVALAETVDVTGATPLVGDDIAVGRRRRQSDPHRKPAVERPAVREPGRHDSRRGTRFPHRRHQEHPVLAADQRRQRAQRQLPDRRR